MTMAGRHRPGQLDCPATATSCSVVPAASRATNWANCALTDYWTASGSYLWKIKDIMSIRGQALYAGVRLEAGQVFGRLESGIVPGFDDDEMIYGGSRITSRAARRQVP